MSFADAVRSLADDVETRIQHVHTEEAAKQALILPFLAMLGFDIYNPAEIVPEFQAGWAKSSEKVDYALVVDGKPAIFVEAKGVGDSLASYGPQLAKYFNSTPDVKFAIITNGVSYRFFTDLTERNLLDRRPFFEFSFNTFDDPEIEVLSRFRKEAFDVQRLVEFAEDLVFLSALKRQLRTLLLDPSEEFIRMLVVSADVVSSRVTKRIVDRFRPLVKQSISAAILDIVGESFRPQPVEEVEAIASEPDVKESAQDESNIETTTGELHAFGLIKEMLSREVPDPDQITFRDFTGYFAVRYGSAESKRSRDWFARLYLGRRQLFVRLRLPSERARELAPGRTVIEVGQNECRIDLSSVEDIVNLREALAAAVRSIV